MKEYLTDLESEKIETFYKDEVMREAVRKVLLASVYFNGTLKPGEKPNALKNAALSLALTNEGTISDAQLGADLRAMAHGVRAVELGFQELEKFKKLVVVDAQPVNPAI